MADKKVERSGRERPITPTQKMEASLSDPGTLNVAETAHDKAKSALVDKYREREERWRREQALHAQQEQQSREIGEGRSPAESAEGDKPADIVRKEAKKVEPSRPKPGGKGGAL